MPDEVTSAALQFTVIGINCDHRDASITEELAEVAGVESIEAGLDTKVVAVHGRSLSDPPLRQAIREAGYEAA